MMIRQSVLMRANDRLSSYIQQYVTLIGLQNREEVLNLFDNMYNLFPHWVIVTCPVMHPDIHYVSKNGRYVLGYPADYIIHNSPMEKFFLHVHEADQQDLFDCVSFAHDSLLAIPSEEHPSYRMVLNYRFKKANGQFIHMLDEKATLNLRGSGNLYYSLFRDITAEKPFTGVKAELFRQDEFLEKIKEFKPKTERNPLSKREQELVTLIKQGLSTKEIAWYLKISHNTVRNIKSKLFEKYNVSNSIELLNMAG
jgi:DNA-binding CsgD family transcriptional regulator